MRSFLSYLHILLWTILIQVGFFMWSPQGCLVPHQPFAFAAAPALAVLIAWRREIFSRNVVEAAIAAYTLALIMRFGWMITVPSQWSCMDGGLALGILLVPAVIVWRRLLLQRTA